MSDTSTTPETGVAPQASPEQRLMAILGDGDTAGPEGNAPATTDAAPQTPQDAQPVEQAPTDELTADDLPEEQAEAPSQAGDEFEIVHNGQQRKLSREETIRLAQQGFDYTQKTQALAEQARAVSERMQRLEELRVATDYVAQDLALVKAYEAQIQRFEGVDWVRLATEDPLEYPKVRAQYDTLRQAYQASASQYQQKQEAVATQMQRIKADMLQQEAALLPRLVPAWNDHAKFQAAQREIADYLRSNGIDPVAVGGRYLDTAFAMATAWKAVQYDKLQKAKSEKVKQLRTAPPVVKPGASQPASASKDEAERKQRDRLRRTGSLEDAASLLLNRMK